jgi:hypothetical protein
VGVIGDEGLQKWGLKSVGQSCLCGPCSRSYSMGVKRSLQSGGVLLSLLTNVLTVLSTATNYWIRQHGGHSGLWQECAQGICYNIPCQSEPLPPQPSRPKALGNYGGPPTFPHPRLRFSCPSTTWTPTVDLSPCHPCL